jgi:uncharacterized protein (TIGR00369 family)
MEFDAETQRKLIIAFFRHQIPFNKVLGLEVEELADGFARIRVPYRAELIGDPTRPALHGGVLSAALDATAGAAAFTLVTMPHDRISTIDLRVDYLRPGELQDVLCEAQVSRMGNRVASVDGLAFHGDERDRPIATAKAVYNVKRKGD